MTSLAAIAQDISEQYLADLPPDYASKLSTLAEPDTVETLFRGMRCGLNDRDTCHAAGIHPSTLMRWQQLGDANPGSAHAAFTQALKTARAAGKMARLQKLVDHGNSAPQHWTALAWSLERTDPDQFALRKDDANTPKVIVQIGVQATEVKVNVLQLPDTPARDG